MLTFQILRAGVVIDHAVFPNDATLAAGGTEIVWSGGSFALPAGLTAMCQSGAGIGWELSNGALVGAATPAQTATQLRAYANAKADAMRALARSYTLAGGLTVLCDATQGTGIDLYGLLTWGTANGSANKDFVQNNGGVVTLTGAQCVALAQAVLAYGQSVFAVLATAMNGVANQTITTTAQIDALDWPT